MDELKSRAGEKLEAIHVAAKTVADHSRSKVEDVYHQAAEAIARIREAFNEVWQHELIAESRARVAAFTRESVQRIKDGAPLLSPRLLYEELVALFKDRVWRRSVTIFLLGACCGACVGACLTIRVRSRLPLQPHSLALHTHTDQTVTLVEDAVAPTAAADEVLIRVQAFSVCPLDRAVLRGHGAALRALLGRTLLTVARGFAGVVLDVGRDVAELELGDEVWGCVTEWGGGAAAELLTIRSTRVSKRPYNMNANEAAALPWAGCLALQAADRIQSNSEKPAQTRICILGAASGEGCMLVQLLSLSNTHLTAVAPRHSHATLHELGAHATLEVSPSGQSSWRSVEAAAARCGPWDRVLLCQASDAPPANTEYNSCLFKSTAPDHKVIELRPHSLLSDRLPAPLSLIFAATFYTYRMCRWLVGRGTHTDWLEDQHFLTSGLKTLAKLVDSGQIAPVLDKVYLPQDFETALAHACSEDAIGTTVIRFP